MSVKTKIVVDSRSDYSEQKSKLTIAGGGMIVPSSMREDGATYESTGTGLNEFRATRKSREETPENLSYYSVGEIKTDSGKVFVLSNDFIEKGEVGYVTVRKTVNPTTKQELWGMEYTIGVLTPRVK